MKNIYFELEWCSHPYYWSRHNPKRKVLNIPLSDILLIYSITLTAKEQSFCSLELAYRNVIESKTLNPKYHVAASLLVIEDAIKAGVWN